MKFLDRQVIDATMKAFGVDAMENSKALLAECTNPSYDLSFGTIAYQKGASILRMIEKFMPEGKFQEGVQKYLKDHKYANAESKDLWNALNSTYGGEGDVAEIMDSWTKKAGFPVVTYNGKDLNQERFFLNTEGIHLLSFENTSYHFCTLQHQRMIRFIKSPSVSVTHQMPIPLWIHNRNFG